jgi:hypothetical protein
MSVNRALRVKITSILDNARKKLKSGKVEEALADCERLDADLGTPGIPSDRICALGVSICTAAAQNAAKKGREGDTALIKAMNKADFYLNQWPSPETDPLRLKKMLKLYSISAKYYRAIQ